MVRGATVMPGYWQNPEATARSIRDGWLMTGDIGWLDGEGYLTLQDRSKDMIVTGGSNVYPREVEEVLLLHPGVAEASVVGRAHPEWGEEMVAFVVVWLMRPNWISFALRISRASSAPRPTFGSQSCPRTTTARC